PLALYLLSFIIVFAHISPRVQSVVVWAALMVALTLTVVWLGPMFFKNPDQSAFLWAIRIGCLILVPFSLKIFSVRDPKLIHRVMIMIMPLMLLLMIFMMLSDIRPSNVVWNIAIPLVALFIVSMVCHGELAQDRPDPQHLTEYFLWMSFGGVVGGLFNGL